MISDDAPRPTRTFTAAPPKEERPELSLAQHIELSTTGASCCPSCQSMDNEVKDSRVNRKGNIRRRRECLACKTRWTTREYPAVIVRNLSPLKDEFSFIQDEAGGLMRKIESLMHRLERFSAAMKAEEPDEEEAL